MGLKKQTRKLFKHRASGDQLKERKAARKLAHDGQTVTEVKTVRPYLQIAEENQALRVSGGKDLQVDTRKNNVRDKNKVDDGE
jgi:hypothetical protein